MPKTIEEIRKFEFLPRGTYSMIGKPKEVANFIAEYASTKEIITSIRGLYLEHPAVQEAIETIKIKCPKSPIKEAYVVEGRFQRNAQDAAVQLGFNSHLIAIVLGYVAEKDASEIYPYNLQIKDEDII